MPRPSPGNGLVRPGPVPVTGLVRPRPRTTGLIRPRPQPGNGARVPPAPHYGACVPQAPFGVPQAGTNGACEVGEKESGRDARAVTGPAATPGPRRGRPRRPGRD